ncbi:MAG: SDR family NAD(P)-dependent oxidoreductase, partial [Alphaproteobacteria bacterium]
MGRVSGKVALVTGGGSGIGKGSAELLAKEGATVVVTDIVAADAKTVADGINKAGGAAISLQHDVTDEKRWAEVIAEVKKTYGKLNILFNNAGICLGGMTWEQSLDDWRRQNAVNLDGVFLGCKHGIPLMRDSG